VGIGDLSGLDIAGLQRRGGDARLRRGEISRYRDENGLAPAFALPNAGGLVPAMDVAVQGEVDSLADLGDADDFGIVELEFASHIRWLGHRVRRIRIDQLADHLLIRRMVIVSGLSEGLGVISVLPVPDHTGS
jgi:hypothetical protein